jgi:hypothetical protein
LDVVFKDNYPKSGKWLSKRLYYYFFIYSS